jgi:error-prone DNA polymerase
VVWQHVMQRYRRTLVESQLLGIEGRWERVEGVAHLIVERLHRLDELLGGVEAKSRDFR